jgi:hypothetical protein
LAVDTRIGAGRPARTLRPKRAQSPVLSPLPGRKPNKTVPVVTGTGGWQGSCQGAGRRPLPAVVPAHGGRSVARSAAPRATADVTPFVSAPGLPSSLALAGTTADPPLATCTPAASPVTHLSQPPAATALARFSFESAGARRGLRRRAQRMDGQPTRMPGTLLLLPHIPAAQAFAGDERRPARVGGAAPGGTTLTGMRAQICE